MRRFAFLLLTCAFLMPVAADDRTAADEDDLFQEVIEEEGCGCGCGSGCESGCESGCAAGTMDLSPAEDAQPQEVNDKSGNLKVKLPAGWRITLEPQEETRMADRVHAIRETQNSGDVMEMRILRFKANRADTFTLQGPSDVLKELTEDAKLFETWFGEGSAKAVRPDVDESILLGGAEKSGQFKFRGITIQEQIKIDKAMKLRNRGDTSVEIPKFNDQLIVGRLAMISPYIYVIYFGMRRDLTDNADLAAEAKQIMDSWEFLATEAKPPPLRIAGTEIGNTVEGVDLTAKPEKRSTVHTTQGTKLYKLGIEYKLPPGFKVYEKKLGADVSLCVYAQDGDNNWVQIILIHQNANALGERQKKYPPKKQQYQEWKSNWESKARGVSMKPKPGKVSFGGPLRGDGYKLVEGDVENFRGTFTGILVDKSGWRTFVEMETRGEADRVFEEQIKDFFKSVKLKKMK